MCSKPASAGTLDLSGKTLTLSGHTVLEGAKIDGGGALYVEGPTGVQADTSIAALLDNTATLNQRADLTFTGAGTFDNALSATDNLLGAFDITSSHTVINDGLIKKTAATGTGTIAAAVQNTGKIEVTAGGLDISGAVSCKGALEIANGATLDLGGSIAGKQTVGFGVGDDVLRLAHGDQFHATISGFAKGDAIDLTGFDDMARVLYDAASGGGGTLSVTDGSQHFSTHLNGTYAASGFSLTHTASGETIHYKG